MTNWRSAVWMGIGVVLGVLGTSTWLHAQDGARGWTMPQPQAVVAPKVFSGSDIGFEVRGVEGDTPLVVPVVRRAGAWIEVALGAPTLRRLTK